MGITGSKTKPGSVGVRAANPSNTRITRTKKNDNYFTVLLQGSGESGKSTILKQMKLIFKCDDVGNKGAARNIIFSFLKDVHSLLKQLDAEDLEDLYKSLTEIVKNKTTNLTVEIATGLHGLLNHEGFVDLIRRQHFDLCPILETQLERIKNFPHWGGDAWVPNDEEYLCSRVRTSGVLTYHFEASDKLFAVVDVGGQKMERRKYDRLFDKVNEIIFVASLSCYDQGLYENKSINRLEDSLDFFEKVCQKPSWEKTPVILFLNKHDLFLEKYKKQKIPLPENIENSEAPPSIDEETTENCELALGWFKDLFRRRAGAKGLPLEYIHVTVAVDKTLMNTIIQSVVKNVTESILQYF